MGKMKHYNIVAVLFFLVLLGGCEEKEIDLFNGKQQLFFEKFFIDEQYPGTQQADSTVASFFFYPDGTRDIEARLAVLFSGKLPEQDIPFRLKVVEELTTASPDEYTLAPEYVFHAAVFEAGDVEVRDHISIQFHRSARLENLTEGVRLVVEIIRDDLVDWGQFERVRAAIILTTKTAQPTWWNAEVTDNLLGRYSEKKYRLFLNNVDTKAEMSEELIKKNPDRAIQLTMQFKIWLNQQYPAVVDEDGKPMEVKL